MNSDSELMRRSKLGGLSYCPMWIFSATETGTPLVICRQWILNLKSVYFATIVKEVTGKKKFIADFIRLGRLIGRK
jgi:hypothetical protein